MFTTIFADASYCPRTRSGGWGAWIKTDGRIARHAGGRLSGELNNNSEAELWAVAKAIDEAVEAGHTPVGQRNTFMVQSDSLRALSILARRAGAIDKLTPGGGKHVENVHHVSPAEQRALAAIVATMRRTCVTVYVRHVPGHKSGEGRAWVNRACDSRAKQHMKAARNGTA